MRWLLASPQERFIRRQEIIAHEARLPLEKTFIKGLKRRFIGRIFDDYAEAMQHYCFYHELTEAIQGVHSSNISLSPVAFYEYWHFVLSDEKKEFNGHEQPSEQDLLTQFRNAREAEKAYAQLGRLLDSMQTFLNTEQIEENIRGKLVSLYFILVNLKDQATRDALRPGGIEDLLAGHIWESAVKKTFKKLNIRGLYFWEVHQQFILYFLGRGQISVRAAINLIMYAGSVPAEENLFNLVRLTASIDGTSDLLKAIPTLDNAQKILNELKESEKMQEVGKILAGTIGVTMLPIGSTLSGAFLLGFMVKSLLTIIEARFMKPTEEIPYKEDYANFLKDLDAQIANARREGSLDPTVEKILGLD